MQSGLAVLGGKVRKAADQTWEEPLGAPQSSQTECLRSLLSHGRYRPGLSHGTLPSAISSLGAGMTLRSSLPYPSDALPTPNIIPCTGCTLYFSFKYLLDTDFMTGTVSGSGDSVLSVCWIDLQIKGNHGLAKPLSSWTVGMFSFALWWQFLIKPA